MDSCGYSCSFQLIVTFTVCDDGNGEERSKDQNSTINLFGEGIPVTVKGHFTDTEWKDVAIKIETVFNDDYNSSSDSLK